MSNDRLIDELVAGLKPSRPRDMKREMLIVGLAGLLELALYLGVGAVRPDIATAVTVPSFWWKLISLAIVAAAATVTAIYSFDPVNSPRASLRWLAAFSGISLLVGWALDAARGSGLSLIERLEWHEGIVCLVSVAALSIPVMGILVFLMRKGAPVDRRGSALIVGAAGAAWGAFLWSFHCNHDDPIYIVVWYAGAVAAIALLAQQVLSRVVRW